VLANLDALPAEPADRPPREPRGDGRLAPRPRVRLPARAAELGGTTRLVSVEARGQLNLFSLAAELSTEYAVIVPGDLVSDPASNTDQRSFNVLRPVHPRPPSGTGTPDAADPSHFTIPYTSDHVATGRSTAG
jgi:hypothetical protein